MENKAHYALIGTFVLLAVVAAISFIAWLSNSQFDQKYDEYNVVFTDPVRGLSQGSEVRLNGLKVGDVTTLAFDVENPNSVIVGVQLFAGTPIFNDASAILEPQGLTGLSYLQISPGTTATGLMPERGPRNIPGQMSQFEAFLEGGENVVDGAKNALARVNAVLSEDAIRDFHSILENVNQLTENLKDTDVDPELIERVLLAFEKAATDVSNAAIAVDVAAVDFDTFVQKEVTPLTQKATSSMDKVDTALSEIADFAGGGADLTTDARDAINRLSNSGLTDLEETADGIRRLVLALTEIAEKLEQSPIGFIAGQEMEAMEIPQ